LAADDLGKKAFQRTLRLRKDRKDREQPKIHIRLSQLAGDLGKKPLTAKDAKASQRSRRKASNRRARPVKVRLARILLAERSSPSPRLLPDACTLMHGSGRPVPRLQA